MRRNREGEKEVSVLSTLVRAHILEILSFALKKSDVCYEKYRVFSLTWPASMQIYWNKRKRLHKKRVQLPQDWFGTPTWPPFHCFGTPIWPTWRHVKTLYWDESRWKRESRGRAVWNSGTRN